MSGEPDPGAVPLTNGDMTNGRVPGGPFRLVYLAANTNMNVTMHDDQLAVSAAESLWIETPC